MDARVGPGGFGSLSGADDPEVLQTMARELDWTLFEKAVEITASAVRGAMGGENSQPASYAGEVFKDVWAALKQAAEDLPERGRTGF